MVISSAFLSLLPPYCRFRLLTQFLKFSPSPATLPRLTVYPLCTFAPGSSLRISAGVPEKPLPPWLEKGMIVFPLKSWASKKEYMAMGISLHQMGYENLYQSRFSFIYQYFNTVHTSFYICNIKT